MKITLSAAAIALSGAFLMSAAVPAVADQGPRAVLKVRLAIAGEKVRTVKLTCDRDGGSHPTPRAACRLLRAVDGRPGELELESHPTCTREFRPHMVAIWGQWRGKQVKFSHVYANECVMKAAGGAAFTI